MTPQCPHWCNQLKRMTKNSVSLPVLLLPFYPAKGPKVKRLRSILPFSCQNSGKLGPSETLRNSAICGCLRAEWGPGSMCLEHLCAYTAVPALLVIQTHGQIPYLPSPPIPSPQFTAFQTQSTHKHTYLQYFCLCGSIITPKPRDPYIGGKPFCLPHTWLILDHKKSA